MCSTTKTNRLFIYNVFVYEKIFCRRDCNETLLLNLLFLILYCNVKWIFLRIIKINILHFSLISQEYPKLNFLVSSMVIDAFN